MMFVFGNKTAVSALDVNYEFAFFLEILVNAKAKNNFLVYNAGLRFGQEFVCRFETAPQDVKNSFSINQLWMALEQLEQIFALNKKLCAILDSDSIILKFKLKFKDKSRIVIVNNDEAKTFNLVDYESFKAALIECKKWCSNHKLYPTMYAKQTDSELLGAVPSIKHAKGAITYSGKGNRYPGDVHQHNYSEEVLPSDMQLDVLQKVDLFNVDHTCLDPQKYYLLQQITHYTAEFAAQVQHAFNALTNSRNGHGTLELKHSDFDLLFTDHEETIEIDNVACLKRLDKELSHPTKIHCLNAPAGLRTPLLFGGAPASEEFSKEDASSLDHEKQLQDTAIKAQRTKYLCC